MLACQKVNKFSMEQILLEPGTPEGSNIISQMRSHILWMENRVRVFSNGTALGCL